jgi:CDGSH-type Zn-finger protein
MSDVTVRVRDNGPLLVEGTIIIVDADGNRFAVNPDKPAVALCRCGQSANRPFCDGAHNKCGFAAIDRAST